MTASPTITTGTLPNRSVRPPGDRRQGEHPEGVGADDQADVAEAVPVVRHVQRRHGHDQDHHDLTGDQGHDRDRHMGPPQDPLERRLPGGHRRLLSSERSASAYGSGRSIVNERTAAAPTKKTGSR